MEIATEKVEIKYSGCSEGKFEGNSQKGKQRGKLETIIRNWKSIAKHMSILMILKGKQS